MQRSKGEAITIAELQASKPVTLTLYHNARDRRAEPYLVRQRIEPSTLQQDIQWDGNCSQTLGRCWCDRGGGAARDLAGVREVGLPVFGWGAVPGHGRRFQHHALQYACDCWAATHSSR